MREGAKAFLATFGETWVKLGVDGGGWRKETLIFNSARMDYYFILFVSLKLFRAWICSFARHAFASFKYLNTSVLHSYHLTIIYFNWKCYSMHSLILIFSTMTRTHYNASLIHILSLWANFFLSFHCSVKFNFDLFCVWVFFFLGFVNVFAVRLLLTSTYQMLLTYLWVL